MKLQWKHWRVLFFPKLSHCYFQSQFLRYAYIFTWLLLDGKHYTSQAASFIQCVTYKIMWYCMNTERPYTYNTHIHLFYNHCQRVHWVRSCLICTHTSDCMDVFVCGVCVREVGLWCYVVQQIFLHSLNVKNRVISWAIPLVQMGGVNTIDF